MARPCWLAVVVGVCVAGAGCGYRFTPRGSTLPGGVSQVCAPVFTNDTAEPALETLFTGFLRRELTRAGKLGSTGACDARVEGTLLNVSSSPTIVAGYFRVSSTVRLRLVKADGQPLNEVQVSGTEDYLQGTGDILEAERYRQAALNRLAEVLMRDGYDRLANAF